MLSREEQEEYAGFVETQLRDYSLTQKIKTKIRNFFISNATMENYRGELIRKTGPYFADYMNRMTAHDTFMTELQARYFERRIRTLPRHALIRLHDELERIEQVRSPAVREQLFASFCNSVNLTYSLNGWFLHIFADELRKKQQP
ncbi:hypothetical protein [Methanoregula sp.]|uniref:hypothetical protein n=1 Tax=Methanoregula sp. TaxID=2052170 RepID=UPI002CBE37F8|nr:hypothetical protein [Methanoregula sp.]HVP96110.1 hypothetical protein [Methanoregula sp.]